MWHLLGLQVPPPELELEMEPGLGGNHFHRGGGSRPWHGLEEERRQTQQALAERDELGAALRRSRERLTQSERALVQVRGAASAATPRSWVTCLLLL
jgi:hypothetical protein